MMEKWFQRIIAILERNGSIESEDREVYLFALNTVLVYMINIILSAVIGLLFGMPLYCAIFLLAFVVLRQEAGGYHTSGWVTCYLLSGIVLIFTLVWVKFEIPFQTLITTSLMLLASGIIYTCSPLESDNKVLESSQREKIRKKARKIVVIEALAGLLLLFFDKKAAYAVSCAIIWCGGGFVVWFEEKWVRGKK